MGLFDKFVEKATNAIENALGGILDEKEQKDYELILNILYSAGRLTKNQIKKFLAVKHNLTCDESELDKILGKFDTEYESRLGETWYRLTSSQRDKMWYKNKGICMYDKFEVCDICYADFCEEIRAKFLKMYEVVKENPSEAILKQAIDKIDNALPESIGGGYKHRHYAVKVMGEVLCSAMLNGDALTRKIALERAFEYLFRRNENRIIIVNLYALALRAFHYASYPKDADKYLSITEEDCFEAARNSKHYAEVIKNNPFDDKDEIIRKAAESIFEEHTTYVFNNLESKLCCEWIDWACHNVEFVDATCYYAWLEICKTNGETADNIEDAVQIISDYFENVE